MDVQTQISNIAVLHDYITLELLLRHLAPTTVAQAQQRLRSFEAWLDGRPVSAYTAKLYLAELSQRGYSPASVELYYHAIKPFLEWLDIPLKLTIRTPKRLPRYHSTEQITSILDAVAARSGPYSKLNDRDVLLISFLALTGMRKAELLNLRVADIQNNTVYIRKGKGDKDRAIPLAQTLAQPLFQYIRDHNLTPTDRLCPIRSKQLHNIARKFSRAAGIHDLTPHTLRHYFATALLQQGVSIKAIQELLGHANISTTAIYLDVVPQHLQSSIDLLNQAFTAKQREEQEANPK